MGKTLIMIGGSRLQLPGLRWAREAGLEVCLTDARPDCPGRRVAMRFHPIDATDVEALVALARDIHRAGDLLGAYCSDDAGLEAVAAIGAATGTPANSLAAVRRALDRSASTAIWREQGVATTTGRVLARGEDAEMALAAIGFPCLVQPADGGGSRGVVTANDAQEASAAIRAAFERSPCVLIERPLEGLHLDVNGFFRDGAFVPGGVLERFSSPPPHPVPISGMQPAGLSAGQAREVYELVERAARALDLHVGPIKADVVWCASGPAILTLAPRFHDDVTTAHVTPLAHGKSPIQAWFATLADAGGPFDAMPLGDELRTEADSAAGWMAIFPDATGELAEVAGLDAARRLPGIAAVTLHRPRGHTITSLADDTSACGFLWATGRDAAEVESRLRAARALIEVKTAWRSAA